MEISKNADGVTYCYTESFWTGKRNLSVDGEIAKKLDRRNFRINEKTYTIKGNFLSGVSLEVNGKRIPLAENTWYDWILIILPIMNIVMGVLCGAIGGFLSALFGFVAAVVNAMILRSKLHIAVKILLCILTIAISTAWFGIYYVIALAIYGAL